ncbi:jg57 [Pararge aegeria aegeria]|uniref:Jg57 protein n=1 Tax=Pararge aegeria aegeria TaxID=348720 RepID=A0A8S4R216_9NEOP|nr:jg57 [Pararge aegeria aegeria]
MNRVLICDSLLRRNETEPFLKKLITGDERSWSTAGQASQTVAKPGLTRNKMMLCVWWDWKGIIQYELLPPGRTIYSKLYCEQLMRLKQEVERKRPELINRKGCDFFIMIMCLASHTSLAAQQKLRKFGWEVLMHQPYSPDHLHLQIFTCFGLFRILQAVSA